MVFFRSTAIKVLLLMGLLTLLVLRNWPFTEIPRLRNNMFWEELSIVGGIIYLMGIESCITCTHQVAEKEPEKQPPVPSSGSGDAASKASKRDAKKEAKKSK
jgi:hypothetical protein